MCSAHPVLTGAVRMNIISMNYTNYDRERKKMQQEMTKICPLILFDTFMYLTAGIEVTRTRFVEKKKNTCSEVRPGQHHNDYERTYAWKSLISVET